MVILFKSSSCSNLVEGITKVSGNALHLMSDSKYSGSGADWTQLLTDPSLVSHLGELLQVYREAAPEKRDQALLEAMRNIRGTATKMPAASKALGTQAVTPAAPVVQRSEEHTSEL